MGVGPGESRSGANRARYRGLAERVDQVSGVGKRPSVVMFRGFLEFPQPPKFVRFPEFPRRQTVRPGTDRWYLHFGRRGVRICGLAIGGIPGSISGANSLRSSGSWGREPAPQVPSAPPPRRDFSGIPGVPETSEIRQTSNISAASDPSPQHGSLVFGFREPRGSDLRGCDWQQNGPYSGG